MGRKPTIIKNTKPIKFGSQVSIFEMLLKPLKGYQLRMMIDELDRGTIPGIPQEERAEGRETKSKKAEIQE